MDYTTKVLTYNSKQAMERGIAYEQTQGWEFVSTNVIQGSYGCAKTGCLGCIFLPLALLGKKGDVYQVVFRKGIPSETVHKETTQKISPSPSKKPTKPVKS